MKKLILLMDDDPLILNVTGKMIEALGYDVVTAAHGEELLEKFDDLQKEGKSVDAVIMDLTIDTGMDAETVMPLLVEKYPDVKVVVSTGDMYSPMVTDYDNYGFKAVLNKPYRIKDLSEVLQKMTSK